jgi:beta-glucosidase
MEGFFTPKESGTHTLALSAVGWCKLFLDGKVVVDHSSDADMGRQNTKELKLEGGKRYAIKLEYYWKGNPRWRSVSLGHMPPQPKDTIAEAVKLAKKADVVVVIASLNGEWETEGADRVDMKLPGDQNELIKKIAKVNKNTIVAINVGSPVEMPWIDDVPAVLQLWYDGQEQGTMKAPPVSCPPPSRFVWKITQPILTTRVKMEKCVTAKASSSVIAITTRRT